MTDFDRHLAAASGYCDLGLYDEANEALEDIDPEQRLELRVLVLRERVYRGLGATDLHRIVVGLLATARVIAERDGKVWPPVAD